MTDTDHNTPYAELDARYHGVIDAAVDGIVLIDERGKIDTFNAAAERIFGYAAADVLGRNVSMLMPEPDSSAHDQYLRNYLEGNEAKIIGIGREVVGRRKDGSCFPLDLSVGEAHGLKPRQFVGILRDITERREVETKLAEREQSLGLIVDYAPIGIFTTDLNGRFTSVNAALKELAGYQDDELLQMDCAALSEEAGRQSVRLAWSELGTGSLNECSLNLRWYSKVGAELAISLHAVVVRSPGKADFIIGQVINNTERLKSETESREAQERLAHVGRVTTLGEMASAIAHEINQPLTAIAAYAQASMRMLGKSAMDVDATLETFDAISQQALRAGDVVKRIRSFIAHRESARTSSNINEILDTVIKFAAMDAKDNGVKIGTEFARGIPTILVDPIQIQQVCVNLIRNAIDAMANLPEVDRRLSITTSYSGDRVEIRFADNGPGIDHAIRDKLFQPFHTTKSDGMGMGLSISSTIVTAHEGTMRFVDGDTGGTVFIVSIPTVD